MCMSCHTGSSASIIARADVLDGRPFIPEQTSPCNGGPFDRPEDLAIAMRPSIRLPVVRIVALVIAVSASLGPGVIPAAAAPRATILSTSDLPAGQRLLEAARSLKVAYRTSDGRGRPRLSSAAVYLPRHGGTTAISWAHGSNGLGDHCAPTRMGRPLRELDYFRTLLRNGYTVVATDYIGLGTDGEPGYLDSGGEANAMADLVTAVAERWPGKAIRWFADGHSQGAHAALNAAAARSGDGSGSVLAGLMATSVPPPFDRIIGVAGPSTPEIPGITGLYAMALHGFSVTYPELRIERHLSARGVDVIRRIVTMCSPAIETLTAELSIGDLLATSLTSREAGLFERYLRIPTSGYRVPVFLGHGLRDATLPFPTVVPLVAMLRASGTQLEFKTYDATHDGIIEQSVPDRIAFVSRHAGQTTG